MITTRTDLSALLNSKNPMNDPLVTIITPTWDNRLELIEKCIPSIRAQTYKYIEHLVIGDGIDFDLRRELDNLYYFNNYVELGRCWSEIDSDASQFEGAKTVGIYLAKGEYIMLLPDNKTMPKDTVAKLVKEAKSKKKQEVSDGKYTLFHIDKASAILI